MRHTLSTALSLAAALTVTLAAGAAEAAPNLTVSVSQAPGALVYQASRYTVTVSNVGQHNATAATLTIQLPRTNTSPQVYVMGTVSGLSSGCSRSGATITCSVSALRRNRSQSFTFDYAAAQSTASLEVRASVSGGGDTTSDNNSFTHAVAADNVPWAIPTTTDSDVNNSHCTGTGLTSYYECTLFPSSISAHDVVFHANGDITIPSEGPQYGGRWSQPTLDTLEFHYTESSVEVARFVGASVHNAYGRCFEGIVSFPGSTYVSPYRVCVTPRP